MVVWIPVGSVEFVHEYMKFIGKEIPLPLNVPDWLYNKRGFLLRKIYQNNQEMPVDKSFMVKHKKEVKHESNGIYSYADFIKNGFDCEIYQVSDMLTQPIKSEWRVFVLNDEAIDIRNYSGDPFCYPENNVIKNMVVAGIGKAPKAYTLDIAVLDNGTIQNTPAMPILLKSSPTVIVECHSFYACGLYGFNDNSKLLQMYIIWWKQFMNGEIK